MASATLFDFYEQQHQQQKQEAAEAEFLAHELLCFQDSSSSSSSNSSCFIDLQPPPPASNSLFDLHDDCFDINALMEEDILYPLPDDAFISSPIPSSPPQLPKKPILHGATTIPPPPPPPPQPQFDNHYYGDCDLLFPEPEPFPYPSPEQQKYYYAVNRISTSSIDNQLLFVPPLYPELTNNKRLKLMPSYHDEDYDLHHPLPPLPPAATNCCTFDDGIVPSSINTSCTYNGTDPQQFNSYALMNPAGILGQVPLYPNYTTGTKYLPTAVLLPHDQQKFAVPLQVPPLPPPSQKETAGAGTNIVSAQSIAARERRRRITEKTQEIAKLVPGGTKMNTAEMLQSAFKYVKFLQAQVGLLRLMRSPHCSDHQSQQGVGEQMDIQPNLLLLLHSLLMSQSVQEKLYMTEFCLIPADFLNTLLAADRSGGTDAYEFTSSSISDQVKELLLRHSSQSQPLIN